MFTTMHSFLFFFIPMVVAIILGILFEEHLIAFEQRVIAYFRARRHRKSSSAQRPTLKKVQKDTANRRRHAQRPAA